jgi:hypothetical protein
MGLAERRRIAAIKDTVTAAQAEFKAATGLEIPFDFDTTTLPEDEGVLNGYDYYKEYAMPMIIRIFKDLTRDAMGKEAVLEKIKSIKILNTSTNADNSGEKAIALSGGELQIKYGFNYYNGNSWTEDDMKTKIENML